MIQKLGVLCLLTLSLCQTMPTMAQTTAPAQTSCTTQAEPRADEIGYQYRVINGIMYKRLYNFTQSKPLSD